MKKKSTFSAAVVLCIVSAIAAIVGIAFAMKSSTPAYELMHKNVCVSLLVVAAVLQIGACLLRDKLPEILIDLFCWGAVATEAGGFSYLFTDRVSLMGFTYFSTLAAGNQSAMDAMNAATVAMIAIVISMVLTSISGFFSLSKSEN